MSPNWDTMKSAEQRERAEKAERLLALAHSAASEFEAECDRLHDELDAADAETARAEYKRDQAIDLLREMLGSVYPAMARQHARAFLESVDAL